MYNNDTLSTLLKQAATSFDAHDSDIARAGAAALRQAVNEPVVQPPATLSQCEELPTIFKQTQNALLSSIESARKHLQWRDARGATKPAIVQAQLAFVPLVGPDSMILNDALRVGLLLQCRDCVYPNHRHAAEELYLVASGNATWSRESAAERLLPPSSFIHHQSWEPHAMVTHDEPMLALWCWTGDIRFSEYEML